MYQFHIIWCGTTSASGLQRVNKQWQHFHQLFHQQSIVLLWHVNSTRSELYQYVSAPPVSLVQNVRVYIKFDVNPGRHVIDTVRSCFAALGQTRSVQCSSSLADTCGSLPLNVPCWHLWQSPTQCALLTAFSLKLNFKRKIKSPNVTLDS